VLEVIQEAVDLQQQLPAQCPSVDNPDLALSLNNLTNHLSDLGHHEWAVGVIWEVMNL
jgi:hypothetical protein